jgi:hypothetical protein
MLSNGNKGLQTIKVAPLTSLNRNNDRRFTLILANAVHSTGDAPQRILESRYVTFLRMAKALDRMELILPRG